VAKKINALVPNIGISEKDRAAIAGGLLKWLMLRSLLEA
jgi:hypothetical protein